MKLSKITKRILLTALLITTIFFAMKFIRSKFGENILYYAIGFAVGFIILKIWNFSDFVNKYKSVEVFEDQEEDRREMQTESERNSQE